MDNVSHVLEGFVIRACSEDIRYGDEGQDVRTKVEGGDGRMREDGSGAGRGADGAAYAVVVRGRGGEGVNKGAEADVPG